MVETTETLDTADVTAREVTLTWKDRSAWKRQVLGWSVRRVEDGKPAYHLVTLNGDYVGLVHQKREIKSTFLDFFTTGDENVKFDAAPWMVEAILAARAVAAPTAPDVTYSDNESEYVDDDFEDDGMISDDVEDDTDDVDMPFGSI